MEDMVIVESKDYAQVLFDDVCETYANARPLECSFTLSELLTPANAGDMVAIFKVGFVHYTEYLCAKPVNVDKMTTAPNKSKGTVVFDADMLPCSTSTSSDEYEHDDFYQFVYVSHTKQIRGASIPFQFVAQAAQTTTAAASAAMTTSTTSSIAANGGSGDDYVDLAVNEEAVAAVAEAVAKKEAAMNYTIGEIRARCEQLSRANETYEQLVRENEALIGALRDDVQAIKLRCSHLTSDNERLNDALRTKTDTLKSLADTMTTLSTENEKLQARFDSLTAENANLLDSLQHRIGQVEQLRNDLETVKVVNKKTQIVFFSSLVHKLDVDVG